MSRFQSTTQLLLLAASILCILPFAALQAEEALHVGDQLSLEKETSIEDIAADPHAFEGQRVRVRGEVSDVCRKKGCWMDLSSAEGNSVRVKVEDDVIVFPTGAVGREAVVEGEVRILRMEREAYVGWMRHMAEDAGETFDESTVGDGPYELVQIQGSGAEIAGP